MPSPFPGMDPYLEGYLWPDVHSALASKIRQYLVPLLRPKYIARLEVYLTEDPCPEGEVGILYPDVEVLETVRSGTPGGTKPGLEAAAPASTSPNTTATITPPTLALPLLRSVPVRLTTVEIRDVAHNRLVTSIEILSPVNKREPGLAAYRQKCQRLYAAKVHLLELDLLRRGTRPFAQPRLPQVPYCMALTRAQAQTIELWPVELSQPLPTLPVPLAEPDLDVPLPLQPILAAVYEEAAYDLSLDYTQPPPPPSLSVDELRWIDR